ncbi:hypothetical protein J4207_00375 [Candidatus Woesearchaeota archaeon]|nr:hypothetical protein [Candidatus Woesearchaeota archaeon]
MLALCRYGEIFLKGNNRSFFERALVKSILRNVNSKVRSVRNRIFVTTENPDELRTVFGLTSFSPATPVSTDLTEIMSVALSLLKNRTFSTFAVRTQRLTKQGKQSNEINALVGDAIAKATAARVDLNNADITVGIEIIDDKAYVFTDRIQCPGGLPYGVSGTVYVRMDDEYAELAALLMMKRGCAIFGIGTKKETPVLRRYHSDFAHLNISSNDTLVPIVRGLLSEDFNTSKISFYPLIGMTEQDVEQRLAAYARIC